MQVKTLTHLLILQSLEKDFSLLCNLDLELTLISCEHVITIWFNRHYLSHLHSLLWGSTLTLCNDEIYILFILHNLKWKFSWLHEMLWSLGLTIISCSSHHHALEFFILEISRDQVMIIGLTISHLHCGLRLNIPFICDVVTTSYLIMCLHLQLHDLSFIIWNISCDVAKTFDLIFKWWSGIHLQGKLTF